MKIETCKSCSGRCGFGISSRGVLSYTHCCSCLGKGVIDTPDNSEDELDIAMRENELDAGYWWEGLHNVRGESL